MNRNIEWNIFVEEVKKYLPIEIDFSAQKAVWNIREKSHIGMLIKIPVVGFFTLALLFIALANTSTRFANAGKSLSFFQRLIKAVTINPNLRSAAFK